jgi:hypothetical protein
LYRFDFRYKWASGTGIDVYFLTSDYSSIIAEVMEKVINDILPHGRSIGNHAAPAMVRGLNAVSIVDM